MGFINQLRTAVDIMGVQIIQSLGHVGICPMGLHGGAPLVRNIGLDIHLVN